MWMSAVSNSRFCLFPFLASLDGSELRSRRTKRNPPVPSFLIVTFCGNADPENCRHESDGDLADGGHGEIRFGERRVLPSRVGRGRIVEGGICANKPATLQLILVKTPNREQNRQERRARRLLDDDTKLLLP